MNPISRNTAYKLQPHYPDNIFIIVETDEDNWEYHAIVTSSQNGVSEDTIFEYHSAIGDMKEKDVVDVISGWVNESMETVKREMN